ncbi:MAG: proton-conducting transporter membrane subunit [Candidatus Omnitrophica bacterium]|nr:proton-conducting transporter membrane subunit [Candidatus Omnitrophota bacterium]
MYALLILVPLASSIILNLLPKGVNKRIAFGLSLALSFLQALFIFFPACPVWKTGARTLESVFRFNFFIDNLTSVMLLCISIVVFVTLLASRKFIESGEKRGSFINVILVALIGMNGAVLTRDIFSLYVFLEITAVSSFILIALDKDILAFEGAFKYIVFSAVASVLMLAAISLLLLLTGSTDFNVIHALFKMQPAHNALVILAVGLFLCGLFIKAGLMPFHGWLPDAYSSAPAHISVLLAGVVTKVAGIYALIRIIVSVLGFTAAVQSVLLLTAALSVILGAIASLTQSDFRRMLAYSSISQVGYIVLGLGSGTALGIAGAIFHIFNHATFKSLLFVNCASVEKQTGIRDMRSLSGLAQRMPVTGVTSVIGSLSCAGIPPLAGFWSKLMIIIALWMEGYRVYAFIAILGSLLTLAYFLYLQRSIFFGKLNPEFKDIKEAGFALTFPAILLTAIIILVGLAAPLLLEKQIFTLNSIWGG